MRDHFGPVRIDLHVHTAYGSACAELHSPLQIPGRMRERGLNGIVITEHDLIWSGTDIRELNAAAPDLRIFRGIEVTTSCCHVVVIGLDTCDGIFRGMSIQALYACTRGGDAALILVHPQTIGSAESVAKLIGYVDALEVASSVTEGNDEQQALRLSREYAVAPVAGSDAHCTDTLGSAYTVFPYLPNDEKGLAHMIRNHIGRPVRGGYNQEEVMVC